jgi:hypothetical protein
LRRTRDNRNSALALIAAAALASVAAASPSDHWSFQKVKRPPVPQVRDGSSIRNPIDAFILETLEANGLTPAPEAERRTLIRRLSFDLIGLPPTPEDVQAFVNDSRPDAYQRLVDRLLASPHYGERWGRHWLDLVRFGETRGYQRDYVLPNVWRYRDWVIAALNRDLPYNRFLLEQLAGDELPDRSVETRVATGMYRVGLYNDEPADGEMDRYDRFDDFIKVVGGTMLGLTLGCARCHDHKSDPIPQADYYRMLAFFTPSKEFEGAGMNVKYDEVMLASPEELKAIAEKNKAIDTQVQPLSSELDRLCAPCRESIRAKHFQTLDNDTMAAFQTPVDRRTSDQQRYVTEAGPILEVKPSELDACLGPLKRLKKGTLERQIQALNAERPPPPPKALALTDKGPKAGPTKVLMRGNAHKPGAEVVPGFLSAIDSRPPKIVPPEGGQTTGRRLALARWIARPENPLTARVIVNRLWHYHFGRGLVATPSDFGTMGEEPSHPELLDWLASELVARGWSLKAMHRLIVESSTYRRSGRWDAEAAKADPDNAWLWRRAPRRLEAEPIRDTVLAVAGMLNSEVGGPSVTPPIDPAVIAALPQPDNANSGWPQSDPFAAARRSIYVFVKRGLILPELEILDFPETTEPCAQRRVSTVAPQALSLLNGAFVHDQAARLAERLRREAGDDPGAQVDRAFALALSRPPTATERQYLFEFLAAQEKRIEQRPKAEDRAQKRQEALRALCLIVFNMNEFVMVD